jgi:ribosomal protein S18 acetylase RimI-like enzyme
MYIEEHTVVLENGQEAIIRSVVPGEAYAYITCYKKCCEDSPFQTFTPEEVVDTNTMQDQLSTSLYSSNEAAIACVLDGEIIATGTIQRGELTRLRHRIYIEAVAIPEYAGQGIERALIEYMTVIAKELPEAQFVWTSVVDTDTLKQEIYKQLDFEITSLGDNALLDLDGTLHAQMEFAKRLHPTD